MAIDLAQQSGNRVIIRYGNTNTSVSGKLIGFTPKAVFVQDGHFVKIFFDKNGSLRSAGTQIHVTSEEVLMFGNCVGLKRNGSVALYDEEGKPAGRKQI